MLASYLLIKKAAIAPGTKGGIICNGATGISGSALSVLPTSGSCLSLHRAAGVEFPAFLALNVLNRKQVWEESLTAVLALPR